MKFAIDELRIPYDPERLLKWKNRDPAVVPEAYLQWNGPGISNGYGFGEWTAKNFFLNRGYKVIDQYNILAKNSKFKVSNAIMIDMIGKDKINRISERVKEINDLGIKVVTDIDLFVYNEKEYFFAEVKKERDRLRPEQMRFIHLARMILNTEGILVYLDDKVMEPTKHQLEFELENFIDF